MALSQDLINQFAKLANVDEKKKEETLNGVVKVINDREYVQLDGSDILTPVSSTVEIKDNERVQVLIKNHTATVTGNLSSPAARTKTVENLSTTVDEWGNTIKRLDTTIEQQNTTIIQQNTTINQKNDTIISANNTINEQNNKIQALDNTIIEKNNTIESQNNKIEQQNNSIKQKNNIIEEQNNTIFEQNNNIKQQNNTIVELNNNIKQQNSTINQQNSDIIQQNDTIRQQNTTIIEKDDQIISVGNDIKILNSAFKIEDDKLIGLSDIIVDNLKTTNLNAAYANIDFAKVQKIFSDSGIIKDLIVSQGKITGELVGVTIKGDLIEGNTIKADKLVVKGSDGLFYKLNVDALGKTTADSDEKYQNGLDGSNIIAKSIVAEKIAVDDLVAFGATIGGFHIGDHSLYSGVKTSANNTTRGIFMNDEGELAFGDSTNYIKYYKDENGEYKFDMHASSLSIGTNTKSIEEQIKEATGLEFVDTRNDNQNPEWYFLNYPKKIACEIKNCSVIGLPYAENQTSDDSEELCSVITYVPSENSTNGFPKQTAKVELTGNEYYRVGISNTEWSEWLNIYDDVENTKERINSVDEIASNASKEATEAKTSANEAYNKVGDALSEAYNAMSIAQGADDKIAKQAERFIELLGNYATTDDLYTSLNGLTNVYRQNGGNNLLYYSTDFWGIKSGSVLNINETKIDDVKYNSVSGRGYSFGKGSSSQIITSVKNGKYTINFYYKKLLDSSVVSVTINGITKTLTSNGWDNFIYTFEVVSNQIEIEFTSDTANSLLVADLMCNFGDIANIWTQNPNETMTDTVVIGKGITIKSDKEYLEFKADTDGIRMINNKTNIISSKYTDKGMETEEMVVKGQAKISGSLWQIVGDQTWISSLL